VLALALAAGCVDATNYLGLGRVFTANMTGNTVLLGVALAQHSGADALRAVAALAGFCAGGAAGVALVGTRDEWPARARWPFALEACALAALLGLWWAAGVGPVRYLLIAVSGVAMGAQSAAVRASDVRGVNTTYITSTLLNAIARLIARDRGGAGNEASGLPGATWVTYAVGALGGAFAVTVWHAPVIAFPAAVVCAVVGLAFRNAGHREDREER
jgi:uncharacterized membrane protein YoaK (UPF0700 family)